MQIGRFSLRHIVSNYWTKVLSDNRLKSCRRSCNRRIKKNKKGYCRIKSGFTSLFDDATADTKKRVFKSQIAVIIQASWHNNILIFE